MHKINDLMLENLSKVSTFDRASSSLSNDMFVSRINLGMQENRSDKDQLLPPIYPIISTSSSNDKKSTKRRRRKQGGSSTTTTGTTGISLRTREKERLLNQSLTLDVNDLKQQVKNLQLLRQILNQKVMIQRDDKSGSLMKLVHHYYQTFRHGYCTEENIQRGTIQKRFHLNQQDYLYAVMDQDAKSGRFYGLEMVIDQWKRYSSFFHFVSLELAQAPEIVNLEECPIVQTVGKFRVRLTRRTMEEIFPHVLQNEMLVQQLIGLELSFRCHIHFYFDTQNKIVKYELSIEYVTTLGEFFPDMSMISLLMSQAKISEECMLGELEYQKYTDLMEAKKQTRRKSKRRQEKNREEVALVEEEEKSEIYQVVVQEEEEKEEEKEETKSTTTRNTMMDLNYILS